MNRDEVIKTILERNIRVECDIVLGQLCHGYDLDIRILQMLPKLSHENKRLITIAMANSTIPEVEDLILNGIYTGDVLNKLIQYIVSRPKNDIVLTKQFIDSLSLNRTAIFKLIKICNYGIDILKWIKPKMTSKAIYEIFLAKVQGLSDNEIVMITEGFKHMELNHDRRDRVKYNYTHMLDRNKIEGCDLSFL